jgi:hypothetical protein
MNDRSATTADYMHSVQGTGVMEAIWVSQSVVRYDRLQSAQKQAAMTAHTIGAYRRVQQQQLQQVLHRTHGFHILNLHQISQEAPDHSAFDGIHYVEAVYDAAAAVLVKILAASVQLDELGGKQHCMCESTARAASFRVPPSGGKHLLSPCC